MAFSTDSNLIMPVAPTGFGGGFGGGFDGDAWLIIIIIFALFGNGFGGWGGGFGGAGNMMLGYDFPWLLQGQNGINANVNDGFRDQMLNSSIQGIQSSITSGFGDTALGIAGINQNICQTGNSVVSAVNGAQNAITAQMYGNQIADLERSYAAQTATTQGFNGLTSQLANCCCENRLATANLSADLAREACATRTADAQNTQSLLQAVNNGIQSIKDQLCQDKIDAKNDEIANLRQSLAMKDLAASQTAQNAFIANGFANEVDQLYNRLNSCPVPTTPVYGRTPIFTCNNGCGCNGNFYN